MKKAFALNGFQLKIIAAIFMVADHVHSFFSFTNVMPNLMTQLGRLSAPIFLFLLVEGFFHTKNRLRYFFNIYVIAALMVFIRFLINYLELYRTPQSIPNNGILSTFAIIIVAIQGIEWLRAKRYALGISAVFVSLIVPYYVRDAVNLLKHTGLGLHYLLEAFLPMHTLVPDGGTLIVACGLALYLFRPNRYLQSFAFALTGLGYYFYTLYKYVPSYTLEQLLFPFCQWMMIFAVVFFLLYNGRSGRSPDNKFSKYFFYFFYPAHIYILYFMSYFLYPYLV